MKVAERLGNLPPYMFAVLDEKAGEKRGEGIDIISFGIGDPDLPTPEFIVDSLREAAGRKENMGYPSSEGERFFREAIADWYKIRFGVDLDPEKEAIALIGSKEGLANIARGFVNPGDRVLVPDPAYPVYKFGAAILCEGVPVDMPLKEENGFLIDINNLRERGEKAKMMFFGYPNNPTTAVGNDDFFREVAEFGEDYNVILCHDNAYSEITYDYKAPSFLQFYRNGVEFHSCSKTFNMTGFRIGFCVGNAEIIGALKKVKSQVDSGASVFTQQACVTALRSYTSDEKPECVRRTLDIYKGRRDVLVNGLNELGLKCEKPRGTFYVWAKVGGSSIEFASKLLDVGVVVSPGVSFGEYGEGYVRFSFTVPTERIKEALERIGDKL